jgi:RNA polymerase sigma-70 factor, ECF subfamily
MELEHSVPPSTNLPALLSTTGSRERLKSTGDLRDSSDDQEQRAALANPCQRPGRPFGDPKIVPSLPHVGPSVSQQRINYASASDHQLIAASRSFDGRAFEELSSRYTRSISKTVYRIVRNREDTEDVMQDSLLNAYRRLSEFREACGFATWLTKIAMNTARMLLRKRRTRSEIALLHRSETDQTGHTWDIADSSPSTEERYSTRETRKFMALAVNELPPIYRGVLEQFHLQEKSLRQAADTLGISVASAKSRLCRGRRTLRTRLEAQKISILDAC